MLRILLWLPYCGLFASLFLPPPADDAGGVLRFLLVTWAAAAVTIALAAGLRWPQSGERLYRRLVGTFAAFTVAVAILTAILHSYHM